jgi:hypothetical protein
MKKLIFVLILLFSIDITHRLLLLLPFTWFKSEVKDTVVEPVVQVEKRQTGVLFERKVNGIVKGLVEKLVGVKEEVVVKVVPTKTPSIEKGTLFLHYANNQWGWFYKSNGDMFEGKYFGEIVNGKPHGMGTITYPNGFKSGDGKKELIGEWKNGETWNITRYDKNGNITKKWVNGVKQ